MQSQLSKAAKHYIEESHQLAAWNFLESHVPDDVLDQFFELYCAGEACIFNHQTGEIKEYVLSVK